MSDMPPGDGWRRNPGRLPESERNTIGSLCFEDGGMIFHNRRFGSYIWKIRGWSFDIAYYRKGGK